MSDFLNKFYAELDMKFWNAADQPRSKLNAAVKWMVNIRPQS